MEIGFYPEQLWIEIPMFMFGIACLIASGKFKRKRQFVLYTLLCDFLIAYNGKCMGSENPIKK